MECAPASSEPTRPRGHPPTPGDGYFACAGRSVRSVSYAELQQEGVRIRIPSTSTIPSQGPQTAAVDPQATVSTRCLASAAPTKYVHQNTPIVSVRRPVTIVALVHVNAPDAIQGAANLDVTVRAAAHGRTIGHHRGTSHRAGPRAGARWRDSRPESRWTTALREERIEQGVHLRSKATTPTASVKHTIPITSPLAADQLQTVPRTFPTTVAPGGIVGTLQLHTTGSRSRHHQEAGRRQANATQSVVRWRHSRLDSR